MRVCHVVPSVEEQHGGPSKSVRALCHALARAGQSVDLFTTAAEAAGEAKIQSSGLRTTVFKRDWPDRICPSSALRRATETTTADVVHHHSLWLRTLHYAHVGAGNAGAAFVISPRGMMSGWAWEHHAFRKRLARHVLHPGALEAAHGWHATSNEEEREIRALGFTQPICVAPNGIEAPDPAGADQARAHWLAACPEAITRPVALFYSRFHSKKRVRELIDVWLRQAPPHWLLLLVGIPQEFNAADLQRYAQQLGGSERVRAFDGLGLPAPYGVASLFLLPSHNENFGLVIAEALAHGIPALVTDTTPWRELPLNEGGWCVPWDDFGEAVRAATNTSAEDLYARGMRAKHWVLSRFSWDDSARRLGEFYAILCQERK